ncbi:MAG: hypothetical protein ACMXYD_04360 [Candidatus Woesearchaeota archaeon]
MKQFYRSARRANNAIPALVHISEQLNAQPSDSLVLAYIGNAVQSVEERLGARSSLFLAKIDLASRAQREHITQVYTSLASSSFTVDEASTYLVGEHSRMKTDRQI